MRESTGWMLCKLMLSWVCIARHQHMNKVIGPVCRQCDLRGGARSLTWQAFSVGSFRPKQKQEAGRDPSTLMFVSAAKELVA